jgi:CRP/FNR family transcriptional regulator, dissimilatory nitrate respiration regulator
MLSANSHLDKIRHIYLFDKLSDAEFNLVAEHSTLIKFSAGGMLFTQGDYCHHFYVVIDGMLKLYNAAPNGMERVLELICPKQLLGVDAMFVGQYSANAVSLEPTCLIAFDSKFFVQQLHANPALGLRMMTLMGHRQQNLIDEIGNLSLQSAIQRVTQYLIKENSSVYDISCVIRFNTPRKWIASRLGLTPETFSRIIAKLRNEGMIDCIKDCIVLKNVASLRQVADGMNLPNL